MSLMCNAYDCSTLSELLLVLPQVSAYPPFPGTEANFLRAQLARIAASTVFCDEASSQ